MKQQLKVTSTDRTTKKIMWGQTWDILEIKRFASLGRYGQLVYYDDIIVDYGGTVANKERGAIRTFPAGYRLDVDKTSFNTIMTYEIVDVEEN